MSETLLPTPIMTSVGLAEGDVLLHLEVHGATSMRGLVRALPHPASIVTMAVGSLIRRGLIRGVPHELELILEPVASLAGAAPQTDE